MEPGCLPPPVIKPIHRSAYSSCIGSLSNMLILLADMDIDAFGCKCHGLFINIFINILLVG